MRFAILGPVEVGIADGRVEVRGRRRRALLVRLLVSANDVVPAQRLLDDVWDGTGRARTTSTLTSHVLLLREIVGRDRLVSQDGGYRLSVETGELDLSEFEADLAVGRRSIERGETSRGIAAFGRALARWRGPALCDVIGLGWADREAARVEELRRGAVESLIDARLGLGQSQGVVAAAEAAVSEEPLRERRWAALMLALYRSGRQADALRAYQRLRSVLGAELGIDPTPGLTRLDEAILHHEPTVDSITVDDVMVSPRSPVNVSTSNTVRRAVDAATPPVLDDSRVVALPARRDPLIGRHRELDELRTLLVAGRLVTLTGIGGIGKTRLAVETAHLIAADDLATAFVDLAVISEPAQVVTAVAVGLRVPIPPGVAPAEALIAACRDRSMLLVIDNAEHLIDAVAELVGTILDRCRGCRLLVTSRQPLHVPGERVWQVAPLDPTSTAAELFRSRLGAPADHEQTAELCRRLDGIPLAIELAAATCRTVALPDLVERLGAGFDLLLDGRPADHRHASLHATLGWSHDLLTPSEQQLLHRLTVFNGGFSLRAVEAICAPPEPSTQTARVLAALVDKSLVVFDAASGRHWLLETVRHWAAERLGIVERARSREAHARWFLAELLAQPWVDVTTMRPFVPEASNLLAAADWWTEQGRHRDVVRLLSRSAGVWIGLMQERHVATRTLDAYERCRDQLTACEHAVACALFGAALHPGRAWRQLGVGVDPQLTCRAARSNAVAVALADADRHPARIIESVDALRALPGGLDPDMRVMACVAEAQARCRLDDIDGASAVYTALIDDRTSMFWCGPMLALAAIRAVTGDIVGAEQILAIVDQHPHRHLRLGPLTRQAIRAQLDIARGDLAAATAAVQELEVLRDQFATSHRSVDHLWFETAAYLAAARGDVGDAARLARAAERTIGDGESSPFVTWALRRRHGDDAAWRTAFEQPVDLDASRRLARRTAAGHP